MFSPLCDGFRKGRFSCLYYVDERPAPNSTKVQVFPWSALITLSIDSIRSTVERRLVQLCRQQILLATVFGHRQGALQLFARFGKASQLREQICPDARQQMIVGERGLGRQLIERVESSGGTLCHSDRYRAVQRHDGRWADLKQGVIVEDDLLPISLPCALGLCVARGNRRLQRVRAGAATEIPSAR